MTWFIISAVAALSGGWIISTEKDSLTDAQIVRAVHKSRQASAEVSILCIAGKDVAIEISPGGYVGNPSSSRDGFRLVQYRVDSLPMREVKAVHTAHKVQIILGGAIETLMEWLKAKTKVVIRISRFDGSASDIVMPSPTKAIAESIRKCGLI